MEALQSDNIEDKAAIIDTLLNRVIVYKDRVEVFLNLLPINDMNSDLQITDEDIESCGLLEPTQKEKVAQKSDFPREKNFGDPTGTRTRVTAVKGRCLRPLDHGAMLLCGVLPLSYVNRLCGFCCVGSDGWIRTADLPGMNRPL